MAKLNPSQSELKRLLHKSASRENLVNRWRGCVDGEWQGQLLDARSECERHVRRWKLPTPKDATTASRKNAAEWTIPSGISLHHLPGADATRPLTACTGIRINRL